MITVLIIGPVAAEMEPHDTEEQVRHTIEVLEKRIALQGTQIANLVNEMATIDADLAHLIRRIIAECKATAGGVSSNTKNVYPHWKHFKALKRSMEFYLRNRSLRSKDLIRPSLIHLQVADLTSDSCVLSHEIEKWARSILEITSSFAEHHQYKQFERHKTSIYENHINDTPNVIQKKSSVFPKNTCVTKKETSIKKTSYNELQKNIAALERNNVLLKEKMNCTGNADELALCRDQVNHNIELMGKLTDSLTIKDDSIHKKKMVIEEVLNNNTIDVRREYERLIMLNFHRKRESSILKKMHNRLEYIRASLPTE